MNARETVLEHHASADAAIRGCAWYRATFTGCFNVRARRHDDSAACGAFMVVQS